MSLRRSALSGNKSSGKVKQEKVIKSVEEVVKKEVPKKEKKKGTMPKHFRSIDELPPDEAFAIRSNGGINSGKARREKASLKKCMEMLLDMPVSDKETIAMMSKMGIDARELTYRMLVSIGLIRVAANGNVSAAHEIREIMGEAKGQDDGESDINIMITRAKRRKPRLDEDDED